MIKQQGVTWRLIVGLVAGLLVLAACGGDEPEPIAVTATPRPSPTWAPTWTVAPTEAPLPSRTPAPTSTSSIREPTFAPPLVTGLRELGDQLLVTVRQDDLNTAIADAFRAADIPDASNPPELTFEPGFQLELNLQFTNPFLDRTGEVVMRTRLEYSADHIDVVELTDRRDTTGIEVAYESMWTSLDLVEIAINTMVFDILNGQVNAADYTLNNIQLHHGSHLEAYFTANSSD